MMGAMLNNAYRKIPVLIVNDVLYECSSIQMSTQVFYTLGEWMNWVSGHEYEHFEKLYFGG
jgi:hypothetical protein